MTGWVRPACSATSVRRELNGRPEGLPSASFVNLDNLHTVAKRQLTKRAGSLRSTREIEIKRALGHALGWVELSAL